MTEREILIFASHNANKLMEIRQILGDIPYTIHGLHDIAYSEEIIESGDTLEDNALIKARALHDAGYSNVFADDTGLEVYALNNRPGVHTARFAGAGSSAEANMNKLLELLENETLRDARFRTVIALIMDGKEYLFEGIVEGRIATGKKGEGGFGYDPIFIPESHSHSFAEMTADQKNAISHRKRAFAAMLKFMRRLKDS